MIIEVNDHKVERSILRQRELIERTVDHFDIREVRLFPALSKFRAGGGICRINHAFWADDLRKNRRIITAARPDIRHFIAGFDAVEF